MFTKGRAALVVSVLAALAVTSAAVALAAGSALTPKLRSPNGKHVNPGQIQLTAKIAGANTVFFWISRKRKVKKGKLAQCTTTNQGCLVAQMKRNGHDRWSYKAPSYNFPGWWATTPGKYYWQVQSITARSSCKSGRTKADCAPLSKVGTFTVR
jgi:hypothetical protein